MDAEPVFVDTNVLVHANNEESPYQQEARQRLLDLAADGHPLWISRVKMSVSTAAIPRPMFVR